MNGRDANTAAFGTLAIWFCLVLAGTAWGQEVDCLKCHRKLASGATVHTAVQMGCVSCHSAIDASNMPHKSTNKVSKGLTSELPELCYGCHDRAVFEKKNVHAAVQMGCTGCHDPHSSKNAKLVKSEVPQLCFNCHDKKMFSGKTVHAPVAGGMCLTCHTPHASDQASLMGKAMAAVCQECHPDVASSPHAIRGFSTAGHLLEAEKRHKVKTDTGWEEKVVMRKDPARPGKLFSCASCHEPHSSGTDRLFRFKARSGMELCAHCHKY